MISPRSRTQPRANRAPPPTPDAGVLPSQRIEAFIKAGQISAAAPILDAQIQPASLDLRLGEVAYRVRASFLPSANMTVLDKLSGLTLHEMDISRPAVLERGCVYIIPLLERLELPVDVSGRANPKSTTGRLDVFTRLITDHGTEFERVPRGYHGRLYAEVIPRTFSVLVRAGTRLNQLRLIRGDLAEADQDIVALHGHEPLIYLDEQVISEPKIERGLWISVDLLGRDGSPIVGYKAKRYAPLVELDRVDHYDPLEFWEPIVKPSTGRLILDPDDFYILASRERVSIPPWYAAEMVGYDASVGEFRIHYAGFFDPGFGYGRRGTQAVLEVRSHGVPFLLEDGQRVGRLTFEPLLAEPDRLYGAAIGSSYNAQALALSKQFKRMNDEA